MPYEICFQLVKQWVDFHGKVNGEDFEFSIPGGGFISMRELVEILDLTDTDDADETSEPSEDNDDSDRISADGVAQAVSAAAEDLKAKNEEVDQFMKSIEKITFSNPDLVSVSKVEKDTTVGAIKDRLSLECDYSADLTDEEIADINARTVKAGDWALISLKAFDTEETLTVTMKDGKVLIVKVTDALIGNQLNGKTFIIKSQNPIYAMTTIPVSWGNSQNYLRGETVTGINNQIWTFEYVNNNQYRIKSASEEKYIGISNNDSSYNGTYNLSLVEKIKAHCFTLIITMKSIASILVLTMQTDI